MFNLYAISYGSNSRTTIDCTVKIKYHLSLIGEYKVSCNSSLLYLKTNKTFDEVVDFFEKNFTEEYDTYFTIFILEKGNYKCINESDKILEWLWK